VDIDEVLHDSKLWPLGRPPLPGRPSGAQLDAFGIVETTAIGNGHDMLLDMFLPP
jgi:hypothetical protein